MAGGAPAATHHQHFAGVHERALGAQLAALGRSQLRAPQLAVANNKLLKRVGGHAGCGQHESGVTWGCGWVLERGSTVTGADTNSCKASPTHPHAASDAPGPARAPPAW